MMRTESFCGENIIDYTKISILGEYADLEQLIRRRNEEEKDYI